MLYNFTYTIFSTFIQFLCALIYNLKTNHLEFNQFDDETTAETETIITSQDNDVISFIRPEVIELVANLSGCSTYRTQPNCSKDFCYHRKFVTTKLLCYDLIS